MMTDNVKRDLKHGRIYTCKRLNLLKYLRSKGFIPFETIPELTNPKFLNWQFVNTPELEDAIDEYFDAIKDKRWLKG